MIQDLTAILLHQLAAGLSKGGRAYEVMVTDSKL